LARDPTKYIFDGVRFPSVTEVLSLSGWSDYSDVNSEVLDRAAVRGSEVHDLSEQFDLQMLDPDTLPLHRRGYMNGYRRFHQDYDCRPLLRERVVKSFKYRVAGQMDIYAFLNGKLAVIDVKTAREESRSWGLQLAGYAICLMEEDFHKMLLKQNGQIKPERYGLRLGHEGTYELDRWPNDKDYTLFLAATTTVNAQIDAGLVTVG
jgi:hypothetical protein